MPLLKKQILNEIQADTDIWHQNRLAKFTSSEIFNLMGDKAETQGALSYIRRKVGEELSGLPCRNELETEATKHGKLYEPEAIKIFGAHMKLQFLVTQKMVVSVKPRESSTPDAIWVVQATVDGLGFIIRTAEIKCLPSYDAFIELACCETPKDVYKVSKKFYFQVLHQMRTCDASVGYLVVYHPLMKAGKMRIIEFKKSELREHFKLMEERMIWAVQKFGEILNKMISISNPTNSLLKEK